MRVTKKDMVNELNRELTTRRQVFPRWVAEGKMAAHVADRRLLVMERALALVADGTPPDEDPQADLFETGGQV